MSSELIFKKVFNELNSEFIQQIIQRGIQINGGISYKFCYINMNSIIEEINNTTTIDFLINSIHTISSYFKRFNFIISFVFIYNKLNENELSQSIKYNKNKLENLLLNNCEDIIMFKDITLNLNDTFKEDINLELFLQFLNFFDCYILSSKNDVDYITKTQDWKNKYIIINKLCNLNLDDYDDKEILLNKLNLLN